MEGVRGAVDPDEGGRGSVRGAEILAPVCIECGTGRACPACGSCGAPGAGLMEGGRCMCYTCGMESACNTCGVCDACWMWGTGAARPHAAVGTGLPTMPVLWGAAPLPHVVFKNMYKFTVPV